MPPRDILCIVPGGDAEEFAPRLRALGWQPACVTEFSAANRVLAARDIPIGLLVINAHQRIPDSAIESCFKASSGCEWVVACAPLALESPGLRELVLGYCFAHQMLPLDWNDMASMLEHAGQRAMLLRRGEMATATAAPLGMVGKAAAIMQLRQQIRKVAATDAPVLIGGESGTGKELVARAIHAGSRRATGPCVAVNCGAISASLIHAELFGHERGAFTGAASTRRGLIEAADGGTIFLDEIGDLPLELQTNLLRFLQEKTISRLGSARTLEVDARVIAASHVDLVKAVTAGRFREDLFYRLNVLPIEVPPLRDRMEDVPALADFFFRQCAAVSRTRARGFSRQAMAAMAAHSWPGNVRELYNRVQRAVVMSDGRLIGADDLGLAEVGGTPAVALDAVRTIAERDAIERALNRAGRNVTQAARELGVSRMTLYRLMEKHGVALTTEPSLAPSAVGLPVSSLFPPNGLGEPL